MASQAAPAARQGWTLSTCSVFVRGMPERFPLPWTIKPHEQAWEIRDANDFPIAYVYFAGRAVVGTNPERLTREQARRIAANIARLPELLATRG